MIARSVLIAGLIGLLAVAATATVDDVECGGTATTINSTKDLPADLPGGAECTWTFDQGKNGSMYIYFENFALQPGDTFTVRNDSGDGAVDKIVTLSGAADPSLVVFTTLKTVQLKFKAAKVQTNATRSFFITYTHNSCDVELNQYHSSIANPIYQPQPGQLKCTYHISSSHNSSIALSFSKLNVTKGTLKVWQGDNQTVAPVINYTNPTTILEDVISPTGKLTMELMMGTATPNQTMSAGFTSGRDDCTKTITVTGPMTLSSPGYPSKYVSHEHCRWILKVPKNQSDMSIKAMFVDLDLATNYDYVVVNAGGSKSSPSLGVFMKGSPLDQVLVSGNGMMYVEMRTDDASGGRGFHMALTLSPYDRALSGSGRIELFPEINITAVEEQKGTRVSSAAEDMIFYQLTADEGKQAQIVINGTATSMFPTSVIGIHDGHDTSFPVLARFRSDTPFFTVQSSGRNMLIILDGFKRNGTITRQTFAANFTSVEQGNIKTLSDVSGVVQLNASCTTTNKTWIVSTYDSSNQVALRIHSLDLDVGEALNVYDGLSPYDLKIVKLDKDVMNTPVIYAKQMRIEYVTNNKTKLFGNAASSDPVLSASYEQVAACGNQQVGGTSGVISSPEWPNRYPYNSLCSWVFQPVAKTALHLAFTSFALFEEHSLTITVKDYHFTNQTVNVTSTVIGKFTGETMPNDVIMDMDMSNNTRNATREIWVEFSSKYQGLSTSAEVAAGFQMNYEYIHLDSGCSGNVTNGSVVSTPGFPNTVTKNLSCLWIISEPPHDPKVNTTVNVIQYTLELQHVTQDNTTNRLEIHDGGSLTSTLVPVKLTDGTSGTMQSRTNQLWIKYTYTKLNTTKEGFAFQIKFNNLACPLDKQCGNGICMQDSWKCNGIDDCGDMSDEKDCTCTAKGGKKQYSGLVLGLSIVATMILTLILAFVIPIIYRRIKYPNYSELRDLMAPVPS